MCLISSETEVHGLRYEQVVSISETMMVFVDQLAPEMPMNNHSKSNEEIKVKNAIHKWITLFQKEITES